MAGTARPIARGTLDMIALQQKKAREAQRKATQRQQTPTHPVYPDMPDEAVEGQIAFTSGAVMGSGQRAAAKPQYRAAGAWHPFGAGQDYGYVASSGTIAFGTTRYWDLSGGAPGDPPVTDSPDVFTADTFSAGPAAGKGAIVINHPGFYQAWFVIQIIAEETDATVHFRATEILFEGPGSHYMAGFQTGSQNTMILGYQAVCVLIGIGADGYKKVGLSTTNNDGSGTPSAFAYLYLQRRDDRDWTTLSIPP